MSMSKNKALSSMFPYICQIQYDETELYFLLYIAVFLFGWCLFLISEPVAAGL